MQQEIDEEFISRFQRKFSSGRNMQIGWKIREPVQMIEKTIAGMKIAAKQPVGRG